MDLSENECDPAATVVHLKNIRELFEIDTITETATCKKCQKQIKVTKGATTGMHKHAISKHKITADKRQCNYAKALESTSTPSSNLPVSKAVLELYSVPHVVAFGSTAVQSFKIINDNTLQIWLARMTALDGFPFSKFRTSLDLRASMAARIKLNELNTPLPKSDATIKSHVLKFADNAKYLLKQVLLDAVKSSNWLSLDLDEWTSMSNKRFININVFASTGDFWNLGLVEITGHATSERLLELVKERLHTYGILFGTHIVSVTTDGANTMRKFGRLTGISQQLCLVHGIQLSVIDVLYIRPNKGRLAHVYKEDSDSDEEDDCSSDDEEEDQGENDTERIDLKDVVVEGNLVNYTANNAIKKVRKISSTFRRSAISNEVLQGYVKPKHGKELPLILDCKTRWSSMYEMLARYWKLMDCIEKALLDIGITITVLPSDKRIISSILNLLEPVMLTVSSLCKRDANLLTARASLQLLFEIVQRQDTDLSRCFLNCLKRRIKQRWIFEAHVLYYLHHGKDAFKERPISCFDVPNKYVVRCDDEDDDEDEFEWQLPEVADYSKVDVFKMPSKKCIKEGIIRLLNKVNTTDEPTEGSDSESDSESEPATKKNQIIPRTVNRSC